MTTPSTLSDNQIDSEAENQVLRKQLADALRLLGQFSASPGLEIAPEHFCVYTDRRWQKVYFKDINWIEAERNYVFIYTDHGYLAVHQPISKIEEQLPQNRFSRIHKSYIVANHKIDFIEKHQVGIKHERRIKTLPIGAQFKKPFVQVFRQKSAVSL